MTPADFFRSRGLLVDSPIDDGRWHRVPTEDHPRKSNGAYRWDGDRAYCQNWATDDGVATWRDETVRPITRQDRAAAFERRRLREETQENGWARAAARAEQMLATCRSGHHGYLQRKGFGMAPGLVLPDGALFVPMRSLEDNRLVGAQIIRWVVEDMRWDKKFLPGQRSSGAVFRIGSSSARETILCEGLATGMSIESAVRELKLSMNVIVTFSAHNLVEVAGRLKGKKVFVFADHDRAQTDPVKWQLNPGEAGQRAAVKTGLPWVMSPEPDEDANDLAKRAGSRALAALILDLRRIGWRDWQPATMPVSAGVA